VQKSSTEESQVAHGSADHEDEEGREAADDPRDIGPADLARAEGHEPKAG
jgi:hypothetical protein